MKTVLKSEGRSTIIDASGPFVIIGEKINPTGRKKLVDQLVSRNFEYVRDLARKQVDAGADVLDMNVGMAGIDEVALLPEVVREVMRVVDVPLCIDFANWAALGAALAVVPGKSLISSVNGEKASLSAILPVVREYGAAVIGLTMDEAGISNDPEILEPAKDGRLPRRQAHYVTLQFEGGKTGDGVPVSVTDKDRVRVSGYLRDSAYSESLREFLRKAQKIDRIADGDDDVRVGRVATSLVVRSLVRFTPR